MTLFADFLLYPVRNRTAGRAVKDAGVQQVPDGFGRVGAVGFFQLREVLQAGDGAAAKLTALGAELRQNGQLVQGRQLVQERPDAAVAVGPEPEDA